MSTFIATIAALTLAEALALTGCAGATGESMPGMNPEHFDASAAPDANDADVARMTSPHCQYAIEMADVALFKDGIDERLTILAGPCSGCVAA